MASLSTEGAASAAPSVTFGKSVDDDLRHIYIFHPEGRPGVERQGGIDVHQYWSEYGEPPYRFRPVKQNGSRVHLRLVNSGNKDRRYGDGHEFLPGQFIERRAYSSDLRRAIYWEIEA
jgi:hypothetical protein